MRQRNKTLRRSKTETGNCDGLGKKSPIIIFDEATSATHEEIMKEQVNKNLKARLFHEISNIG